MATIKRSETIDGIGIYATDEGEICDGMGRTFGRTRLPLHAALMIVGEAELAFAFEVNALVKAAAKLLRNDGLTPGALRCEAFAVEYRPPHVWKNGCLVPLH